MNLILRYIRHTILVAVCSLQFFTILPAQIPSRKYEVVVVSGSAAGFGAALAAGRMGAKVALIEDTPVLGGMLTNGVSNIDAYSYESLSGIFDEFRLNVIEHYRPIMATDPVFKPETRKPRHIDGKSFQANEVLRGGKWEPRAADQIFKEMLARVPNVEVYYRSHATDVIKQGNKITGVVTENSLGERQIFYGDVIIDATHEGDIAAWAGVPYRVGREARSPLEPHAGEIYFLNRTAEILDGSTGRQDHAIVSYGLRLIIKNYREQDGTSHLLTTPPPGYDKSKYQQATFSGRPSWPNGKAEMNVNPIGNELQEINWAWPEANRAERQRLYEIYKNHALGFLYFLQHERGLKHLGLPKDEYSDNGNVPYRIYVREARRIEGEATMTEADVNPFILGNGLLPPLRPESIAIGHYPIDAKPVKSKVDFSTPDKGNGDFFLVNVSTPYQVPYGSIVPKQIDGLLVPAALSATHVAFSAVRMDPVWMAIGQAAGTAAVLSVRERREVRAVPVQIIQRELLQQKCRLMFYWDLPLTHPAFAAVQWLSVRQVVTGYPDRNFQPDGSITRAETADLLTKAFKLWPSVSDPHFRDVPYQHWAFRSIETLFDNNALVAFEIKPQWQTMGVFDPGRHQGFDQSQQVGAFFPDKPVYWKELVGAIHSLQQRATLSRGNTNLAQPQTSVDDSMRWVKQALSQSQFGRQFAEKQVKLDAPVSRGEACALIASVLDARQ